MEEGYLVACGPGSEQSSHTTPPRLGEDLDARGYRVHPDLTVTSQSDEDAAADVVELIDERLATFRELLEERPVDVAHCTVFYINVLQHFFWRAEPTARAWKRIDDHIGQIRETYSDATLLLLSDHGC
jgi:predicted AlkP superfamily phosphohydrolase/phosphomutase